MKTQIFKKIFSFSFGSDKFWKKLDWLLGVLSVGSVFAFIFIIAHRSLFDTDIWLHLKTGEIILKNKSVPYFDIFSFTCQGVPWINHEWLFQIISYIVYSSFKVDGLIALETYIVIGSFLVLLFIGRQTTKSYFEISALLFLVAFACVSRFNIRPDIFSLLFFAIYIYLLRFKLGKKIIWLIIPLQIFWVNIHGFFFLGPVLVFIFLLSELIRRNLKFLPSAWKGNFVLSDSVYKRLALIFALSIGASFINPQGFSGFLYPVRIFQDIFQSQNQVFFMYIQELKPTFGARNNFYIIILVLTVVALITNFKKLKIVEIILFLFFFVFALKRRNVPFISFIGFTIIISYLGRILEKIYKNYYIKILKILLCAVFIFYLGFKINGLLSASFYFDFKDNSVKSMLFGVDSRRYPVNAVNFILNNNIPKELFNDFNSGAYLIGRAGPQRKVFIDGRTELYGAKFFKEQYDATSGNSKLFEQIVRKYNIKAVLLSYAITEPYQIIKYIYYSPEWKLVFFDENGSVFLKNIPENNDLIKKYAINLDNYRVPKADLIDLGLRSFLPQPYLKRATIFNILGKDSLIIKESQEAIRIMPSCAEAYYFIGQAYINMKLYQKALENLRTCLLFSPRDSRALTALARCLIGLKKDSWAKVCLLKAINIDRNYAPAYYQLSRIYYAHKQEGLAIKYLRKGVKYMPLSSRYHCKLSEVLFNQAKKTRDPATFKEARKEIQLANQLNMGNDQDLNKDIRFLLQFASVCDKNLK